MSAARTLAPKKIVAKILVVKKKGKKKIAVAERGKSAAGNKNM